MLLQPPRAIAFDCYGTLLDVTDAHFIEACGAILDAMQVEHDRQQFWDGWLAASRALATEAGRDADDPLGGPEAEFQTFRTRWPLTFQRAFDDLSLSGDTDAAYQMFHAALRDAVAYPDTGPALGRLHGRFRLAVVSNADDDHLTEALAANGLLDFEFVLSSEGARSYKPRVPIFAQAAERFGLPPEQVLYVGDSPLADVLGARNAGMRVAWINRARASLPERVPPPDLEIADLHELADALLNRVQEAATPTRDA